MYEEYRDEQSRRLDEYHMDSFSNLPTSTSSIKQDDVLFCTPGHTGKAEVRVPSLKYHLEPALFISTYV